MPQVWEDCVDVAILLYGGIYLWSGIHNIAVATGDKPRFYQEDGKRMAEPI
jgi:hypothetical protein